MNRRFLVFAVAWEFLFNRGIFRNKILGILQIQLGITAKCLHFTYLLTYLLMDLLTNCHQVVKCAVYLYHPPHFTRSTSAHPNSRRTPG